MGDFARDSTCTNHQLFAGTHIDVFFGRLLRALRSKNENLNLLALRVIWNCSYGDPFAQKIFLERLGAGNILCHLRSNRESHVNRAAAVIANLTHLCRENHAKIVAAQPDFGDILVAQARDILGRGNKDLVVRLFTAGSNIAASGIKFSKNIVATATEVSTHFLDVHGPAVHDAALHLICNISSRGVEENGWKEKGFEKARSIGKN